MKTKLDFCVLLFVISLAFNACTSDKKVKQVPSKHSSIAETIENLDVLLETSGSMSGYFNGNDFRSNVTSLIAELDKISTKKLPKQRIKKLRFYTIADDLTPVPFSGSAFDFCTKINNRSLIFGRTSPIDDLVKELIDSSNNNNIKVLISDFVIDKKADNPGPTIQSKFNIIFNQANKKSLGLLIYRFTTDFSGTIFPAIGKSQTVKDIRRPYFIWFIGDKHKLSALRMELLSSNIFIPENEISFGIPENNYKMDILKLSNRSGTWRYENGNLNKAGLKKDRLKFTIAFDFSNYPVYFQDINYLKKITNLESPSMNILYYDFYNKTLMKKKIHKKERAALSTFTHFLEINISEMTSSTNTLKITFKKPPLTWVESVSTNDDSYLTEANNLKTFAFSNIIKGISNAYGDLSSEAKYFEFNLRIKE